MQYRYESRPHVLRRSIASIHSRAMKGAQPRKNAESMGLSLLFDDPFETALCEGTASGLQRRFSIRHHQKKGFTLVCRLRKNDPKIPTEEPLTREETERILHGDTAWMVTSGRLLLVMLFAEMKMRRLKPKAITAFSWRDDGQVKVRVEKITEKNGLVEKFLRPLPVQEGEQARFN